MSQTINVDRLRDIVRGSRSSVQLIDVRSPREYAEGHIPGATNMPMEDVESRIDDLDSERPAVLICRSGGRASICCERLQASHSSLLVLEGGTEAWSKEGLPLVRTVANRLSLMRQVQLGAGLLVLSGTVLGFFVHPYWLLLSGFVGAGLITAGLTGFCGMAVILGKMPWNGTTGIKCEAAR